MAQPQHSTHYQESVKNIIPEEPRQYEDARADV